MKGRPICILACIMAALLAVLHTLGVADRTVRVRSDVQAAAIFDQGTLQDWDIIAAAGQITRIMRKESETGASLKLQHAMLSLSAKTAAAAISGQLSEDADVCTIPSACHILVSLKADDPQLRSGDWVIITGKVVFPAAATCPGQFDQLDYANTNGRILSIVSASLIDYARAVSHNTWLEKIKLRVSASYERVLGSKDAGTMSAITLGDKSAISADLRQLFQDGGISHILAISGLHINLLGMSLYRMLRRRRCSFIVSAGISGALLSLYCVMTGMSSSALRATIMFVIWTGSQITGRCPDIPSALALAACLLLVRSPLAIFDGGFQLSFGCILSLECLSPLFNFLLHVKDSGTLPDKIRGSLASSLSITVGTLPILCLHYYQFNPYAPLLNLIVLPAMSVLVMTGLGGALIGNLIPAAGIFIAAPCHYLLSLFCTLCSTVIRLPGAMIVTGKPSFAQIIAYYSALILVIRLFRARRLRAALALAADISLLNVPQVPVSDLRLIFLDVGQGECVIMQSGYCAVMVDAGSSSVDDVWSYRIEPCLKACGIKEITMLATHGDLDHINGYQQFAQEYEQTIIGTGTGGITALQFCTSVLGSEDEKLSELSASWAQAGVGSSVSPVGTVLQLGNIKLEVLYPSADDLSTNSNENSLVTLLTYQNSLSVLLTGDLEKEAEDAFRERYAASLGKIDVLCLGHHGSKYATSEAFLAAFSPYAAIASAGKNNRYGHPSSEVIERLKQANVELLRTDTMGSIILETADSGRRPVFHTTFTVYPDLLHKTPLY